MLTQAQRRSSPRACAIVAACSALGAVMCSSSASATPSLYSNRRDLTAAGRVVESPRALLIVQKYGGTSVGNVERIRNVAKRCLATQKRGHRVVVIVSAMSGETNRLLGLAKKITDIPDERELDVIAATGEQVTVGLLA